MEKYKNSGWIYYGWYWKENIQISIFVFLEAQRKYLQDNFRGSKWDKHWIFLWESFSFYEKLFPFLTM